MENKKDIEEIPKKILKKVELVLVDHIDRVLENALVLEPGEELFAPKDECAPFCLTDITSPDKESSERVRDKDITAH